jgi:hypothetical protein
MSLPYNGYVAHLRNPLKGFRREYQRSSPDSTVFDSLKRDFVWCSDLLHGVGRLVVAVLKDRIDDAIFEREID